MDAAKGSLPVQVGTYKKVATYTRMGKEETNTEKINPEQIYGKMYQRRHVCINKSACIH